MDLMHLLHICKKLPVNIHRKRTFHLKNDHQSCEIKAHSALLRSSREAARDFEINLCDYEVAYKHKMRDF